MENQRLKDSVKNKRQLLLDSATALAERDEIILQHTNKEKGYKADFKEFEKLKLRYQELKDNKGKFLIAYLFFQFFSYITYFKFLILEKYSTASLREMGKFIVRHFCIPEDADELMIPTGSSEESSEPLVCIDHKYPKTLIEARIKTFIVLEAKSSDKKGPALCRMLLNQIFTEDQDWVNANKFFSEKSDIMEASIRKLLN